MMEEVSDDTNGESTFEFVGGKSDENLLKDGSDQVEIIQPEPPRRPSAQGIANLQSSLFPAPTPVQPSNIPSSSSDSNVLFFDPSQYSSANTVLMSPIQPPPEMPPPESFSQQPQFATPQPSSLADVGIAPPVFQSPPPVFQSPPSQQPYMDSTLPQCSVPLPFGNEDAPTIQGEDGSVWGWFKGTQILNKMKSSVDSVITTLDPGMKEIINSGGDVNVIVATGNETKISAVREAFQLVFGKATVHGIAVQSSSIALQPVGFSAGLKAAEERIGVLRRQGYQQNHNILLAIDNFITELTPENWFDMGCLLLQDYCSNIFLQVYTEAIPIPSHLVQQAKDQTPSDYPLAWSGHAITIGQLIGSSLGVPHSEWHQAVTGVSRREILFLAAKTLAGLYKAQLKR